MNNDNIIMTDHSFLWPASQSLVQTPNPAPFSIYSIERINLAILLIEGRIQNERGNKKTLLNATKGMKLWRAMVNYILMEQKKTPSEFV